jgi:hypothetical protein
MTSILIASFCCAAISFTITTTSIFESLRNLVAKIHPKLDELIHCPWCLNHYVVLVYLLVTLNFSTLVEALVYLFAIVGMGGLIHHVLLRAYEPIAKRLLERKLKGK